MKKLIITLLLSVMGSAQAADATLLERALRCELKDGELARLMPGLAAQDKGFAKPAASGGAPSYDLYRLAGSASAHGYSGAEVLVMPATIALVVDGKPLASAVQALRLEGDGYSPAMRAVRPGANILAFQLSSLSNKLLVGCRYEHGAAGAWVKGFSF